MKKLFILFAIMVMATTVLGTTVEKVEFLSEYRKELFDADGDTLGWEMSTAGTTNFTITRQHIGGRWSLVFDKINGDAVAGIRRNLTKRWEIDAVEVDAVMQFYVSSIADIASVQLDVGVLYII